MIYTSKYINFISLIITIVIFLTLNILFTKTPSISVKNISNYIPKIEFKREKATSKVKQEVSDEELEKWYIEIPKINLKAPIDNGTDSKTLNTKVGHFEKTDFKEGNIGLAAHNRGYEYNYFQDLKKLKIDDEIIYKYEDYKKIYKVSKIEIIKNTDWTYLEKTEENTLTLITCVENEPLYRRCVQAVEIEN